MAASITGVVRVSNPGPLRGYTVSWDLLESFGAPGTAPSWRPARREAAVEQHGEAYGFRIETGAEAAGATLRGPSRFEVTAPTGEVVGAVDLSEARTAQVIQSGRVELQATALPAGRIDPSNDPSLGRPDRITGLVLRTRDGGRIGGAQVFLYGRSAPGARPQLVATAQSDSRGYFFCDRPPEALSEAFASVAGYPGESVPVRLDGDGRLPKRLVLGLNGAKPSAAAADCGCTSGQSLPYASDATDLAASDAYSADLGSGHCVDLTVPNRALEEFSYYMVLRTTDPEIQGLTMPPPTRQTQLSSLSNSFQAYGVSLDAAALDPGAFPGSYLPGAAARTAASGDARAVAVPAAVAQAIKRIDLDTEAAALATWAKKSAGRATLNAANPVDWDDEPTFYQATTIAHGHLLHFKQVWKSFGFSLGTLLYSLPLAPLQKKQIAIVDWERRERDSRTESVTSADSLQAAVSHDSIVQDIVNATLQETTRGGSDAKSSGWGAAGGGAGAIPAGPIPIPLIVGIGGGAANASSTAWQDSGRDLAANALSTLSDAVTQSASALRRQRATVVQQIAQGETSTVTTDVVANNNHCHALTIEYFEVLRHFIIEHFLADVRECLFIPLLMSRFDDSKALRWREPLLKGLRDRRLADAFDAVERQLNPAFYSDFPVARYADDPVIELWGSLAISFVLPRPDDGEDGAFNDTSWQSYATLLWDKAKSIFDQFLLGQSDADRDRIFKQTIAPRLAEAFCDQLSFRWRDDATGRDQAVKLDATLLADYAEAVPLAVSVRMRGALPADMTRAAVNAFIIESTVELPPYSKVVVKSGTMKYRTEHLEFQLFSDGAINNDLKTGSDSVEISCPLSATELRNPRDDDQESAARLVAHLNEHLEHYHKMIWWHMDHDRRFMLLDGFIAPNAKGRSVASVVENRVIAICGNSLIMPVAPGFTLDPAFDRTGSDSSRPLDLLEHYVPATPLAPVRISLPTKGVFAEAVMGACNACEKIDDSRFWKFEEHPSPDEPTPIAQPSTDSRAQPAPNLQPSPLPASIIAMQSAPPAPAPSALTSALGLLGTPGLFNDATGLAANQQNAAAALQATLASAASMGGLASQAQLAAINHAADLERQRTAIENADRVIGHIATARDAGLISDQGARDLAQKALDAQVAPASNSSATEDLTTKLGNLVDNAASTKAPVTATVTNGQGTASVQVGPAPAPAPAPATPQSTALYLQDPNDSAHVWSLASVVQPVSMCLASRPNAAGDAVPLLTVRDDRADGILVDGCAGPDTDWSAIISVESGTTKVSLSYWDGQAMATVANPVEWLPVSVSGLTAAGGKSIQLPLTVDYEIAHATVRNSSIEEDRIGDQLFRLKTDIDYGRLHVFGYVIAGDGTLRALTPVEAADSEFRGACAKFGPEGSVTVLLTVELVLCRSNADYEPSGWLQVARFYPMLGFWCSSTFGGVSCDIRLAPPTANQLSMFSDMNGPLPSFALSGAYRWSVRYAHYVPDASGRGSSPVVDGSSPERTADSLRSVYDPSSNGYVPTPVTKLARQMAFDEVVMAPVRNFEGAPPDQAISITAPLTPSGALHVHWRWGDSFTQPAQLGWGPATLSDISGGTPNLQAGAPQVPWNQTIEVFFDSSARTFAYQGTANAEPNSAQKWQIFMHHGCGYVAAQTTGIDAVLASEAAEGRLPTWDNFFYYNRYTTDSNASTITRIFEDTFAAMEQM